MARQRPPEWWLENPFRLWRYARHLQLSHQLVHVATITPDADGRPGLTCRLPSRPVYGSRLNADRTRTYLQAMLSRSGSIISVVCFQRASRPGDAWDHAKSCIALNQRSGAVLVDPMTAEVVCGTAGVTFSTHWPGLTIHNHFLVAYGWLHGIGIVLRGLDSGRVLALGRRAIETWEWLPPSPPDGRSAL